ncbi:hypothetical protein QBC36DRAFT_350421 [Triangularia setosa]|uniref:Uncharacterized protein n=1 Tax=Triangularia setosa TaxID=2587417 RepID=A0AAN6VX83_9PEZI|nr:hypothetical protein QBC36DRAFT_350421 [Podospora setosa]
MHFSTEVSGAIALLSVSMFALPNELTLREDPVAISAKLVPELITNATALDVDASSKSGASLSDDAMKGGGFYTAEPGTIGWPWIRAQRYLGEYEDKFESRGLLPAAAIEKRQATSITHSIGFSHRMLRANEHVKLRHGPSTGDRRETLHGTTNGPTEAGLC